MQILQIYGIGWNEQFICMHEQDGTVGGGRMTEQEAVETLVTLKGTGAISGEEIEAIDIIDDAMLELEQYREIGTVEECRAAVEKQIPKKHNIEGDGYADGQLVYDTWICPCCEKHYEIDCDSYDYCPNCGQHIDRSEIN